MAQTYTIQQFGQLIKQKHPEYSDLPDGTVGQKVLSKYPQYADMVQQGQPGQQQTPLQQDMTTLPSRTASAVGTAGNLLGITKFGQAMAATAGDTPGAGNTSEAAGTANAENAQSESRIIAQIHALPPGDPRRAHLTNFLKTYFGGQSVDASQNEITPGSGLSNEEVAGSAANLGLDAIGGGELSGEGALGGAAAKINKVIAPFGEGSWLGRVGNKAIQGLGLGAAGGAAQAATDDGSATDIAKSAATGSVLGGVLGGSTQAGGELFKYLTSPEVSESLYNKAIGIDKKTQLADRSPAASMIEQGKIGSKQGLMQDAQKTIDESNQQINDILANKSGATTASQAIQTQPLVGQIKAKLMAQYGDTLGAEGVTKLMEDLPIAKLHVNDALTPVELNSLRQKIDTDFVGNGKWLSVNQDPVKISAYKTAANVLRQTVQGVDDRLPGLYQQLSNSITARNALDSELAKPHAMTSMLEMLGALTAGTGAFVHGGSGVEAAMAAGGALAAEKAMKSTPVQTAAAVGLDRLGRAAAKNGAGMQAVKAAGRIAARRATSTAASSLTGGSTPGS